MQSRTSFIALAIIVLGLTAAGWAGGPSGPADNDVKDGKAPTFYKDMLPVFQDHCQVCHRPGQIGPFSLMDYQSARPWAKAIRTAVMERKMPPWLANPKYGHFNNDRSLSQAQIDSVVAWVDAGAPAGNV